jgi:hypothetical protein
MDASREEASLFPRGAGGGPMKCLLSFLSLLFTSVSLCQTHYPLATGNLWEYWDSGAFSYQIRAGNDTLMPNGHKYTQLFMSGDGASNAREEGGKVYHYDPFSGAEWVMCDFNAKVGDTIAVEISAGDTVVTTLWSNFSDNVFGKQRTVWQFLAQKWNSYAYSLTTFADSIGITESQYEPGMYEYLKGAIIDGKLYGVVTGTVPATANSLPTRPSLFQSYPNPFNPSTTITYELPKSSEVRLSVFDMLGREVSVLVNERRDAGVHEVKFDGSSLASGVYVYRIQAGDFVASKKLLLLK